MVGILHWLLSLEPTQIAWSWVAAHDFANELCRDLGRGSLGIPVFILLCQSAYFSKVKDDVGGSILAQIMTTKEMAKYLRLHQITICKLSKERKIPSIRIGSVWRFDKEVIDEWIAKG